MKVIIASIGEIFLEIQYAGSNKVSKHDEKTSRFTHNKVNGEIAMGMYET